MGKYFGTDGVRGEANVALCPELAYRLGWAAALYFGEKVQQNPLIIIGRDTRISGNLFESALATGICSAGGRVEIVGVCPTPAIAYLARTHKAAAGIVISASHNPFYDNGIKFFGGDGYKLPDAVEDEIESLVRRIEAGEKLPRATRENIGRIKRQQKFMKACMDKLVSPAIIPHLPSIIKEVMSSIKTDLSFRQILEFAGTLKEAQKNGLQTEMVPGKPLYIKGISYWIPDIKKLRNTVAETLNVQITSSARTNLDRTEAEYRNSIPADAKEVPANEKSIGHFSSSTMSSTTSSESATYSSHSTGRSTGSEVERSTERRRSSNAASPSSESSGSNASGESSLDSGAPTQSSGRKTQ